MNPEREEALLALESAAFRLLDAANAANNVQNKDALTVTHLERLWEEAEAIFRTAAEACRDSIVCPGRGGRGHEVYLQNGKTFCRNCGAENVP